MNRNAILLAMTSSLTAAITLAILTVPGCVARPALADTVAIGAPNAPTAITAAQAATDSAHAAADAAAQSLADTTAARDSKLAANIYAAAESNAASVDSPEKTITTGELGIAVARMPGVRPDDAELTAAHDRAALVRNGQLEEAAAATRAARADAAKFSAQLDASRAAYDAAIKERDAARAAEVKAVRSIAAAQEKARVEEDARLRKLAAAEQQSQALWLRIAAILCVLGVVIGGVLGKLDGLKATAPLGAGAVALLGLAQLVSQTWFKYAIGVMLLAALVVYAIHLYKKHQALAAADAATAEATTAAQEAQVELEAANETIESIVPVLDTAYDNADAAQKTILDSTIFTPLGTAMNAESRQIIRDIRAAA